MTMVVVVVVVVEMMTMIMMMAVMLLLVVMVLQMLVVAVMMRKVWMIMTTTAHGGRNKLQEMKGPCCVESKRTRCWQKKLMATQIVGCGTLGIALARNPRCFVLFLHCRQLCALLLL